MSSTIQSIRGMSDILPEEAALWQRFEAAVRAWLKRYGYREIRIHVLDMTEVLFR
jgi:histidyl-tRNA synthetase